MLSDPYGRRGRDLRTWTCVGDELPGRMVNSIFGMLSFVDLPGTLDDEGLHLKSPTRKCQLTNFNRSHTHKY